MAKMHLVYWSKVGVELPEDTKTITRKIELERAG